LKRSGSQPAGRSDLDEATKMLLSNQAHLFELQTELWKARALAKQKWLEWGISEPVDNPKAAERRGSWIKRALAAGRRGQAGVRGGPAGHRSVLEKILSGAADRRPAPPESGAQTRSDSVPGR